MHADQVAPHCVPLHGRVLTQVAAVQLLARLPQPVHAQLTLAGEVTLAGGTLQPGVREVEEQVLPQVGAHLEAATTFRASVSAVDVLSSLCQVL